MLSEIPWVSLVSKLANKIHTWAYGCQQFLPTRWHAFGGLRSNNRPYYNTHMKWPVSLPPTLVDLSFSTRIRITFRKMIMLAWEAPSEFEFQCIAYKLCQIRKILYWYKVRNVFTHKQGCCYWTFDYPPDASVIHVIPASVNENEKPERLKQVHVCICVECMIEVDVPTVVVEISCQHPNNKDNWRYTYEYKESATLTLVITFKSYADVPLNSEVFFYLCANPIRSESTTRSTSSARRRWERAGSAGTCLPPATRSN